MRRIYTSEQPLFGLKRQKIRSPLPAPIYDVAEGVDSYLNGFKGLLCNQNLITQALFFAPKSQDLALLTDKESQEP